jgi:Rne/Rng family ribonuclease
MNDNNIKTPIVKNNNKTEKIENDKKENSKSGVNKEKISDKKVVQKKAPKKNIPKKKKNPQNVQKVKTTDKNIPKRKKSHTNAPKKNIKKNVSQKENISQSVQKVKTTDKNIPKRKKSHTNTPKKNIKKNVSQKENIQQNVQKVKTIEKNVPQKPKPQKNTNINKNIGKKPPQKKNIEKIVNLKKSSDPKVPKKINSDEKVIPKIESTKVVVPKINSDEKVIPNINPNKSVSKKSNNKKPVNKSKNHKNNVHKVSGNLQKMVINVVLDEVYRIGIIKNSKLEELYIETPGKDVVAGNIYKGKVLSVNRALQAAFVDIGLEKDGFLPFSNLNDKYFDKLKSKNKKFLIENCLQKGDFVTCQVIKEANKSKGVALTTNLSIPGRFCVMMPYSKDIGVSLKITNEVDRRKLKDTVILILKENKLTDRFGVIVRTAGKAYNKTQFKRDILYLYRAWKIIDKKFKVLKGIGEIYTESNLIIRTIRDVLDNTINEIIIDNYDEGLKVKEFLKIASPRKPKKVIFYDKFYPVFDAYKIEDQVDETYKREVKLKSGGSIIIEPTEALVSIDVNSGKFKKNLDNIHYITNMEAASEICRQMRLRDIGGIIIIDLINMKNEDQVREVEAVFRDLLSKDRARTKMLKISSFGIMQITRQRIKFSHIKWEKESCYLCGGTGKIKRTGSQIQSIKRELTILLQNTEINSVIINLNPNIAQEIINKQTTFLSVLKKEFLPDIKIQVDPQIQTYKFILYTKSHKEINPDSIKNTKDYTKDLTTEI